MMERPQYVTPRGQKTPPTECFIRSGSDEDWRGAWLVPDVSVLHRTDQDKPFSEAMLPCWLAPPFEQEQEILQEIPAVPLDGSSSQEQVIAQEVPFYDECFGDDDTCRWNAFTERSCSD